MELTKEQRLVVYKGAIDSISDYTHTYICEAIDYQLKSIHRFKVDRWSLIPNMFPELLEHKPEKEDEESGGWFNIKDKESRISVLTECIKQLEND